MDHGPLVSEEIDAGAELARGFAAHRPVEAAFWLKASDDEHRYLYLASDRIDDANLRAAYGEILRLASTMQSPYLDPFRVKLVGSGDPLAKAASEINERFPSRLGTRLGGQPFGGTIIDDAFIYPSPMAAAIP